MLFFLLHMLYRSYTCYIVKYLLPNRKDPTLVTVKLNYFVLPLNILAQMYYPNANNSDQKPLTTP